MDLKFPHHECEIAQAQACNHKPPVNYWMHGNMLTLNGKKMAKSTGNNILPGDLFTGDSPFLSKGYSAGVVRFFMLQAHYRSILDFSDDAILASEKGYNRLMEAVKILQGLQPAATATFDVEDWKKQCYAAMNDDFNSPILIAHLFDAVKVINLAKEGKAVFDKAGLELLQQSLLNFLFEVLGLPIEEQKDDFSDRLSGTVQLLIELREDARINKNWALSDQIRDKLLQLGIQLKDAKEGTTYSMN